MNNFYRIMQGANIVPLMTNIMRNPYLWTEDTFLRNYPQGPFGEVETIMLRFPKQVVFNDKDVKKQEKKVELYKKNMLPGYDQHESIDYPAYSILHEARPLIMGLMALVQGERLGRCMINKINPGGQIFPHCDTPMHAEYYSRYHIVLHSAPGSDFRCDNEHQHMATGEVWWFNNKLEHQVINNSGDERIHLIVDVRSKR